MKNLFLQLNFILLFYFVSQSQLVVIRGNDTLNFKNDKQYKDSLGEKDGYFIYFNNGIKIESGMFKSGNKEGEWLYFYPNGSICQIITFQNNVAFGPAKTYYDDGTLEEEGFWKENVWTGEYKFYHKNGTLAYLWLFDETGKRTGEQFYFHDNGKIMIKGTWTEGKEVGVITEFHEDGSVKSEKYFNEGVADTTKIVYYKPAEKPSTESVYKPAERFTGTGYYKAKNPNGRIEFDGTWINGKMDTGKRFIYDDNGKLIKYHIYKNGIKISEIRADN
ncbi:MAG: toxin-antitoxin system YwqK family antitoxin [Bacteroidales bacterium]